MLILGRRVGQSIVIGDRAITVTILGIDRGAVRLGIEAPKHIPVNREEVLERIEKGEKQ